MKFNQSATPTPGAVIEAEPWNELRYWVIKTGNSEDLQTEVTSFKEKGWSCAPLSGVVLEAGKGFWYIQAMER